MLDILDKFCFSFICAILLLLSLQLYGSVDGGFHFFGFTTSAGVISLMMDVLFCQHCSAVSVVHLDSFVCFLVSI